VRITLLSVRGQKLVRSSASADLSELREVLPQRREELHRDKRVCRSRHRGIQLSEMCGEAGRGATVDDLISWFYDSKEGSVPSQGNLELWNRS
jgi:hypothetical protein